MQKKIKLGITQGDINGVSYEIFLKTFQDNRILEFCTPIIYGSPKVSAYYRKALDIQNFNFNTIADADEAIDKKTNLINCLDDNVRVELGKASELGAEAAFISLEQASTDLKNGKIDALITNPVNVNLINTIKPEFSGNKSYLSKKFEVSENLLFYVSEKMRIGVVAEDIPFTEITSHITQENIIKKLKALNHSLQQDFKIQKPKIAVLSLNPNIEKNKASKEEQEIILPAINKVKNEENILAIGTVSADVFFSSEDIDKFDAVLAMYYDQGISPFKAINFGGINYFAGFPNVIIEPDYDLGYSIAGMGKATENSFRETIYMAKEIFNNRILHKNLTINPLKSHEEG